MRRQSNKAEAVESTALPADVSAALEGATFHQRAPGDDGMPRIVVQPAGMRGWLYGEKDDEQLAKAFPELTEAQLHRACRFLDSLVKNHLRLVERESQPKRGSWVNNW